MKLHLRGVRFFVVSLICLSSVSCFRGIDASKLKCNDNKYCPSGYVCDTVKQQCVASGSVLGDASSQEVGKGDGVRAEVVVTDGKNDSALEVGSVKLDAYLPPVTPDAAEADTPFIDPGTGGTGGIGGAGGMGGTEDTGGMGGTIETGGIATTGGIQTGGVQTGGIKTGGNTSSSGGKDAGVPDVGGAGGTTVKDAAPDTVDAYVPLAAGSPCTSGTQCASTFCADGVCCDAKCDGQCETCSSAGRCTVAPAGAAPASRTACAGTGICGSKCDGTARACVYPTGTTCSDPTCTAGSATASGSCNGSGTCVKPAATPCSTGVCGTNGLCAGQCTSTSCPTGSYCNSAGACVTQKAPGATCAASSECGSTAPYCSVDGVCCKSECNGACVACNSSGNCTRVTGDPRPGHGSCPYTDATCSGTCDGSSDSCTYPGTSKLCSAATCSSDQLSKNTARTCNAAGACTASSSEPCTGQTYCSGGECVARVSSGACTSNVQCTTNPARTCVNNNSGGKICCASGLSGCSGSCTALNTNSNCGSCGVMCGTTANPNNTCQSGSCQCEYGAITCSGTGGTSCGSSNFESNSFMNWSSGGAYGSWSMTGQSGNGSIALGNVAHTGQHSLAVTVTNDGLTEFSTQHCHTAVDFRFCRSGNHPVRSVSFYVLSTASWITDGDQNNVSAISDAGGGGSNAAMMFSPVGHVVNPNVWTQVNLTFDGIEGSTFNTNIIRFVFGAYIEPGPDYMTAPPYTTILYIDDVVVN